MEVAVPSPGGDVKTVSLISSFVLDVLKLGICITYLRVLWKCFCVAACELATLTCGIGHLTLKSI